MAGLLKSYDEWTAALTGQKDYSGGDQPMGIQPAQAPATATPAAPQPIQPAAPAAPKAPAGGGEGLYSLPANPAIEAAYKPLLSPFAQQMGATGAKLQGATSAFQAAAGPSRTFEGIGGQQALDAALAPDKTANQDNTATMGAARQLTHAQYQGPEGLDQATIAELAAAAEELRGSSAGLNRLTGVEGLLQTRNPSLGATQDELAFDAGRLMAREDWQKSVAGLQGDIGTLSAKIYGAPVQAEQFATQRGQEEEAIQRLAREYLTGRQGEVSGGIDQRITQEQADEQALNAAYSKFRETGDLAAIVGQGADLSGFNTPGRALQGEASAAGAKIAEQFKAIQDVPLLSAQIDSHGNLVLGWDKATYDALRKEYGPRFGEMRKQAELRNMALEDAGFSPGLQQTLRPGENPLGSKKSQMLNRPELHGQGELETGKFSALDPLYLGGNLGSYQPPDPRNYISRKEGDLATRENISTAEERATYNRAAELMDQANRIMQAETPHEKTKLTTDAIKFLDDEIKNLEARKDTLDQNRVNYLQQARNIRNKYLKANKEQQWADIGASISGDIGLTTGLGSTMIAPVGIQGQKMGDRLA